MLDGRVTLREAAEMLGISEGAVRKRVKRGSMRSELGPDGRRYVYLEGADARADNGEDASSTHESGTLISELRERIGSLERQLDQANERDRENRRIIAALTQRIPELEAPREPAGVPETDAPEPERAQPQSSTGSAQEGTEPRSWWARVFGS